MPNLKRSSQKQLNNTHVTDGAGNLTPISRIAIFIPNESSEGTHTDCSHLNIPSARRAAVEISKRLYARYKSRGDDSDLSRGRVYVSIQGGTGEEILCAAGKVAIDTTRGDMPVGSAN